MTLIEHPAAADAAPADARWETVYRPPHPLDLRRTVGMLRRGGTDPTMIVDGGLIWRAVRTPARPRDTRPAHVGRRGQGLGLGSGAEHALDGVPALCGAHDEPGDFDASLHPLIAESARRTPGLRLARTDAVFDALACAIIEQKVTGMQAFGAWRWLVSRFGERAPGPTPRPMFTAPTAAQWFRIPSWAWHRAGVEPPQSRTIVRAAERGDRIARAVSAATTGADRDRVLTSLPGVGVLDVGRDPHPRAGRPRCRQRRRLPPGARGGTCAHREAHRRRRDARAPRTLGRSAQRVIRLIFASGVQEPRRGPRLAPEDHRGR